MTNLVVCIKTILPITLLLFASQGLSKTMIVVEDAWIPMAPPTMTMNAGYFTLVNHGHHQQTLVSASSPNYKHIEFHTSDVIDGMVSMKKVEQVKIGSHQSVHFKPGGLHLMMHKPVKPPVEGQTIPVSLVFASGVTQEIELAVKKRQAKMNMHGQGHSHHH